MVRSSERKGPSGKALVITMAGWLGLAACLTMVFLAMRAVMDVGGSCADGGPYVSAQSCPEGSAAALLLGIFGGMGFGFVASVGGLMVGGIWAATPVFAWAALFGSLGWNFIDYGVMNPPESGIEWGFAIPGVMFWVMGFGPLLGLRAVLWGFGALRRQSQPPDAQSQPPDARSSVVRDVQVLPGPGQPPRPFPTAGRPAATVASLGATTGAGTAPRRTVAGDDAARRTLAGIATDFGAVVHSAMAETPADPSALAPPSAPTGTEFTEGTQALLDRLERLADMRDRGLLDPAEYETAKAAIMAELEERS